ncbi:MAG: J domain-containing protein [Myxococcales bacterium]|nr:J domain-containing protein [Myxococcales bacterium]
MSIVGGTPRAISLSEPDGNALGDLLVASGALGAASTVGGAPIGPVGEWLVASGRVAREDVDVALRLQLRRRLLRLFSFRDADYRFRAGSPEVGAPLLDTPVNVAELVLGAMREALAEEDPTLLRRRLGEETLELTPLGEQLLGEVSLDPSELAMVSMLRAGACEAQAVLAASAGSLRALRTLAALKLIRAVAQRGPDSYGLLLRKHREVQRQATAWALLDLPATARPEQARVALRRLARSLHPDRFQGSGSDSARRISHEVLTALVSAEADLRSAR